MTYKIVRYYFKKQPEVIETGLTLEEAQAHCKREDTHQKDSKGHVTWFDGYTKES